MSLVFLRILPGCNWQEGIALLLPALAVICLLSSHTSLTRNVRYALPVLPFLFIWTSQYAVLLDHARSAAKLLIVGNSVWFLGSVFWVSPHWLSYFNETVGGPNHGHFALNGSNIDWGQDLLYLRRWLKKHPEAHNLKLVCSGSFDPVLLGINYTLPPERSEIRSKLVSNSAVTLSPGWYAISVNYVLGSSMSIFRKNGRIVFLEDKPYDYFSHFTPIAKAGYSIFIYELKHDEIEKVKKIIEYSIQETR